MNAMHKTTAHRPPHEDHMAVRAQIRAQELAAAARRYVDRGDSSAPIDWELMDEMEEEKRIKQRRYELCVSATGAICKIVGGLLAVIIYAVAGAYMFMALERPNEKESCLAAEKLYIDAEAKAAIAFLNISRSFPKLQDEEDALIVIQKKVQFFRDEVVLPLEYRGENCSLMGQSGGPAYRWCFSEALLFTISIVTTVGYGNITPKSGWGRMTCIVYALAGLPIMFFTLATVGELLANIFRFMYGKVCCLGACKKKRRRTPPPPSAELTPQPYGHPPADIVVDDDDDDDDDDIDSASVPMTVTLLVMTSYIVLGTILFSNWEEDWEYMTSAYFCFITIATIGFGDVIPGVFSNDDGAMKLIVSSAYMLIGMALMAMSFDLIQYEMALKVTALGGQNLGGAGATVDEMLGKTASEVNSAVMQSGQRNPPPQRKVESRCEAPRREEKPIFVAPWRAAPATQRINQPPPQQPGQQLGQELEEEMERKNNSLPAKNTFKEHAM